jgi:hypothetical protein
MREAAENCRSLADATVGSSFGGLTAAIRKEKTL